jgi:hypothetical protein
MTGGNCVTRRNRTFREADESATKASAARGRSERSPDAMIAAASLAAAASELYPNEAGVAFGKEV